jgi:hypothetical protein
MKILGTLTATAVISMGLALSATAIRAEPLMATYRALQPRLAASPFGRPLYLESAQQDGQVSGDIYAIVQHPFRQLRTGLDTPAEWCQVLILHVNVKQCNAGPRTVQLVVGRQRAGAREGAYSIAFAFAVQASSADRFRVALQADKGPLGTREYRMVLETIPIASGNSFLRLSYSYVHGAAAKLAMGTYLRTLGKDKVGFSVTGRTGEGEPIYVGGLRGILERNTMRYYLAIETYLDSASQPPAAREQWRFTAWYAATERYARQLHELTRAEYLARKQTLPESD